MDSENAATPEPFALELQDAPDTAAAVHVGSGDLVGGLGELWMNGGGTQSVTIAALIVQGNALRPRAAFFAERPMMSHAPEQLEMWSVKAPSETTCPAGALALAPGSPWIGIRTGCEVTIVRCDGDRVYWSSTYLPPPAVAQDRADFLRTWRPKT